MRSQTKPGFFARSPKITTLMIGAAAAVIGLWAISYDLPLHQRLRNLAFDSFQRAAPRQNTPDPGVAVIDIDEASLASLGQWPWPRDTMGQLVENLGAIGVAAIAFDMAFSEPDRSSLGLLAKRMAAKGIEIALPQSAHLLDNDLAFATAIARHRVVLGVALADETQKPLPPAKAGISFSGSDPSLYLPLFPDGLGNLDILTKEATGVGSFSFVPSRDNIIREMPLFARSGSGLYPSLSLEALRVAQGASNFIIKSSDGTSAQSGAAGIEAVKVGALQLPSQPDGSFSVHYSGMSHMPIVSAAKVLERPQELGAQLAGRIALVGSSAIGLRDLVATPLAPSVAGVIVHAEIIDQILTQSFLSRPDWLSGAERASALGLAMIFLALLLFGGAAVGCLGLIGLGAAAYATAFWLFKEQGLLADPIPAIALVLLVFLVCVPVLYALSNRDRHFVRAAFSRYLSPALVSRLSKDPSALKLGGETREVTILFSDIRGFTALSESLPPQELTDLLNKLLTPLTACLLDHEAMIDKYIGDAIMAMWNAPLDIKEHPKRACAAALAMAEVMRKQNEAEGQHLEIGLGLHIGPACVGNLGSDQRFSYSAIGDTVNLAARVEGMTKQYGLQILITQALHEAAPEFAALEADRLRVVGRQEPVVLYALLGDENLAQTLDFKDLKTRHEGFLRLWRQGEFKAAQMALHDLQNIAPWELIKFYGVYEARLKEYLANPPLDWTGIFQATSK